MLKLNHHDILMYLHKMSDILNALHGDFGLWREIVLSPHCHVPTLFIVHRNRANEFDVVHDLVHQRGTQSQLVGGQL